LFIFVQFFAYHSGVNPIPADSPTPSALIFLRQTDLPLSEVYAVIIARVAKISQTYFHMATANKLSNQEMSGVLQADSNQKNNLG
jgi:hypothetical protein